MVTSGLPLINDVQHVSINVNDLDAALAFYVDLLGLDQVDRPEGGESGAWLQVGATQVHLTLRTVPPQEGQHFAFDVADADAVAAHLHAAGHETLPIKEVPGFCRQLFTTDPSGNRLEFNQMM